MAVSSLSAISSALSLIFDAKLARQWNRMARTISLLEAKPGTGKSVNWDASTAGQTATAHTEGADITSGELLIDAKVPMTLNWGLYRNAIGLTEHQLEAALNSKESAEELMQLLEEEIYGAVAALSSKLNVDLFTGIGSASQLCGFDYSLLSTGTYATQVVDSITSLKSNLDANGSVNRALTVELMDKMEGSIFKASGLRPDVIVTSPGVFTKYKSLFETIRRVVGDSVGRYDTSVADDGVFFQGIPVIRDKDCPTGCMYFINRSAAHMAYMPPANFGDSLGFVIKMGMGSNGDGSEQEFGIPFRVQALAKTGDSVKFMLRTATQLVVRRPNALGKISYITE
jgi:hypothetical protein